MSVRQQVFIRTVKGHDFLSGRGGEMMSKEAGKAWVYLIAELVVIINA